MDRWTPMEAQWVHHVSLSVEVHMRHIVDYLNYGIVCIIMIVGIWAMLVNSQTALIHMTFLMLMFVGMYLVLPAIMETIDKEEKEEEKDDRSNPTGPRPA